MKTNSTHCSLLYNFRRIDRCLLPLVFLIMSVTTAHAQWVTIPDTAFAHFLRVVFPACMNGSQMDTTCPAIVNAGELDCSHKHITNLEGIQYFDNLRDLDCSFGRDPYVPAYPATLRRLTSRASWLSGAPYPAGLDYLDMGNSFSDTLRAIPAGLDTLICDFCFLDTLLPLPPGLIYLDCTDGSLQNLPSLPPTIKRVLFGSQWGTPRTNFYDSALPPGLIGFHCYSGNFPFGFPSQLPNTLVDFTCDHCGLTSLPPLPNSLSSLSVDNNQLTSLPPLPSMLSQLSFRNNQISTMPVLPPFGFIFSLAVDSNPLPCLSPLPQSMSYFSFSGTQATCLPFYPVVSMSSIPPLNTMPLCDILTNPNGCDLHWNISGKTYFDNNSDCFFDVLALDTGLNNIPMQLWNGNNLVQQSVNASGNGVYSFNTGFDTFRVKIDTAGLPFDLFCPVNNQYTSVISFADSLDDHRDFAFVCKPGFDLEARSIVTGTFFPGRMSDVHLAAGELSQFYGAHCATGLSGTVTVTITGPVSYVGPAVGALTPTSVNNNVLTYNITDFNSVDVLNDFKMIMRTDTSAQAGQQVCVTVALTPVAGDRVASNNTLTECFTVVNSYDPNDKQVSPAGNIDTTQEWLTYTVRFQNTGTAAAANMHIDDTLDANLDAATFQLLNYSHQPIVQIKQNAVRFNFPDINLPDSTSNEPASHGYVQYKVKLKNNLVIGTQIKNTAAIYFDFNAPVITNTVVNTLAQLGTCSTTITTNDNDNVICARDSITLTANTTAATSYLWSNGATTSSITVAPLAAGSPAYRVTVTDANSCVSADTITLTVNPVPFVSPGGPQPGICPGDTFTITSPGIGDTYLWNTGDTLAAIDVAPLVTTTYTVTITNGFGCSVQGNRLVTVIVPPVSLVSAPGVICAGDTSIITASGGTTYLWSNGSNNPAIQVAPLVTTTYTVTVADGNGCEASEIAVITVNQPSVQNVQVSICAGDSVFLGGAWVTNAGTYRDSLQTAAGCDSVVVTQLTVLSGSASTFSENICAGESYLFNNQNLTTAGNYLDTAININGCDSLVTLTLTVHPLPVPVVTQNTHMLTTDTFSSYQWLYNNTIVDGGTLQVLHIVQNGNYSVIVTDDNGCRDTSAVFAATGVGVEELTNDDFGLTIYPNPNKGNFTLQFADSKMREVVIMDIFGKIVLRNTAVKEKEELVLEKAAPGIYFMRIAEKGRVSMLKVMVSE